MERMEILMNFAALARYTSYSQKMMQKKVSDFRFFHHSESELCPLKGSVENL